MSSFVPAQHLSLWSPDDDVRQLHRRQDRECKRLVQGLDIWEGGTFWGRYLGIVCAENSQSNQAVFSMVYLVGGLEHFLFSHILGIIIPIDFHIFQRGGPTTNQIHVYTKSIVNLGMVHYCFSFNHVSWTLETNHFLEFSLRPIRWLLMSSYTPIFPKCWWLVCYF